MPAVQETIDQVRLIDVDQTDLIDRFLHCRHLSLPPLTASRAAG